MENIAAEGIDVTWFIIFLGAGFVLFVVSLIIRVKTGGKYEIRPVDLVLVLVPVFLWLFGTGKITKFNIAGLEVETAKAFIEATEKQIKFKARQVPVNLGRDIKHNIEMARKAGVEKIPELIKKKTEALEFQLGYSGYWGPAIEKYFETLGTSGFLKYVLIYDRGRKLFGVYEAGPMLLHLQNQGEEGYRSFAEHLKKADQPAKKALQKITGFVSVSDAVTPESNKRSALETMDKLNSDILPVVNKDGQFIGMVDRDKITASMIIDVTKAMEKLSTKGSRK